MSMPNIPNPMAELIKEAVGDAIEDRIRKVVKEELAPVIRFTGLLEKLFTAISLQRGKLAKLLQEVAEDDGTN